MLTAISYTETTLWITDCRNKIHKSFFPHSFYGKEATKKNMKKKKKRIYTKSLASRRCK